MLKTQTGKQIYKKYPIRKNLLSNCAFFSKNERTSPIKVKKKKPGGFLKIYEG
jgi:hypothetical protein